MIVGEVLDFHPTDSGAAVIELGLYPSQVDTIPSNVTAEIVPMLVPTSHTGTGAAARSAAMSVPTSRA